MKEYIKGGGTVNGRGWRKRLNKILEETVTGKYEGIGWWKWLKDEVERRGWKNRFMKLLNKAVEGRDVNVEGGCKGNMKKVKPVD